MILKVLGVALEGWLALTGLICVWAIVSGIAADVRESRTQKRRQIEVDTEEDTREQRYLRRTRKPALWEES